MKIINLLVPVFCMGLLVVVVWFGAGRGVRVGSRVPVLGVLQTASHPALDRARDNFVRCARGLWKDKIDFLVLNAEGSAVSAQLMADELHRDSSVVGICTIGTLATQAMARVEREKPIIITAVSDPESLGILRPGGNVCGTSDAADVNRLVSALRELVPSAHRVALLHNPAEPNSIAVVARLEEVLLAAGLAPSRAGAMSEAELPLMLHEVLESVDAIIVPPDNMIAQALPFVGARAWEAKHAAVFTVDPLLVMKGVLAASGGADYAALGCATAEIAHKVIVGGAAPSSMPIQLVADQKIRVHRATAEHIGVSVPAAIRRDVILQ